MRHLADEARVLQVVLDNVLHRLQVVQRRNAPNLYILSFTPLRRYTHTSGLPRTTQSTAAMPPA